MFDLAHPPLSRPVYPMLTRSLSAKETWGFGLTAHISWTALVPAVHAALGSQAIFVWIPAVLVGILINYQVKRLGMHLVNMAGGTPNYTTYLLKHYPGLARYAAIGYLFSWVSYLSVNAIVLRDLIKVNLAGLNLICPDLILDIGFTLLPFILAFSGTRALSILHLFFVIPAFGILVTFCVQGLGWLAFSPESPGFFSATLSPPNFVDWAKWFFFVTYATYGSETASSFVADSENPRKTLRFLDFAAWLMPLIFIGGSWVMIRLATQSNLGDNAFLNLVAAAQPFWGKFAGISITFLLVSACLLGSATVVSNCPRILYQLSLDKYISSVFSVISNRGVFVPALILMLIFCLIYLFWGNVAQIVAVSNIGWFISLTLMHLGLWLKRKQEFVLFPYLSLIIFILEVVVLFVGGLAWGWINFCIGLLFPFLLVGVDFAIRRISFPPLHLKWWIKKHNSRYLINTNSSLMGQVTTLIFLLCGAVIIGWLFGVRLQQTSNGESDNLIIVLFMTVAFVGVAIACWTSLPQVIFLAEAREAAEHLFMVAQESILVVDYQGIIQQANPASECLFNINISELIGNHLKTWLPKLQDYPEQWPKRSEHILTHHLKTINIEVAISDRSQQNFQEYVVIFHDITQRQQVEEILRQSAAKLQQEAQELAAQLVQSEKMSSLGQLVAGVAHEINNPVSFIYGNINPANQHIQDLIKIIQIYQKHYPETNLEIAEQIKVIDLDFVIEDLPKLLKSMENGAERIKDIVLSLRNFSRLDEAEMKAVNIHDGINSTLMILQSRLKATPQRPAIEVIKKYGNLSLIECYAGQLNQVFMNILANAIDALEESLINSRINEQEIKQSQIIIHTEITQAQQVMIRIQDNGVGIPENIQMRLFEPFFTTKPVGKGTGLGLSISYKVITEKHRGNLQCISKIGLGTEFMITIPLKQK
ncbi:MAG TPA: amino acid permease [Nodularia sp. (in: cyanobacteria)]|nr:amino acid permease [Nodularia sp. (in: cyanobacteria)]